MQENIVVAKLATLLDSNQKQKLYKYPNLLQRFYNFFNSIVVSFAKKISSKKVKMESEDDSSLSREMFQDSTQRSSTLRWATFDDLLDDALEEGKLSPTRFVTFRSLNYSNSILC